LTNSVSFCRCITTLRDVHQSVRGGITTFHRNSLRTFIRVPLAENKLIESSLCNGSKGNRNCCASLLLIILVQDPVSSHPLIILLPILTSRWLSSDNCCLTTVRQRLGRLGKSFPSRFRGLDRHSLRLVHSCAPRPATRQVAAKCPILPQYAHALLIAGHWLRLACT